MDEDLIRLMLKLERLESDVEKLNRDLEVMNDRFNGWIKALGMMVISGVFTTLLGLLH